MNLHPLSMTASTTPASSPINVLIAKIRDVIEQPEREGRALEAHSAPAFDLFRFMRVTENSLSVILADLLDLRGTHGQGPLFLNAFLALLDNAHWRRPVESCHLKVEHQTNINRRIDLTLSFPHGVIGIESKPWAGDEHKQLLHYAQFLSKRGREGDWSWLLVFLCNRPPTTESLPDADRARLLGTGHFVQLTFRDVVSLLEACRLLCQSSKVNIFLDDLTRFIRTAINGDMAMTDRSEVVQTLMNPDNIEAAFVIAQSLDATKRELLHRFRIGLNAAAHGLGYCIQWNLDSWNRGAGFYIRRHASDRLALSFEFEGSNLTSFMWGLSDTSRPDGQPPLVKESEDYLLAGAVMTAEFDSARTSAGWPWYSPPNDASLRTELSHWDKTAAPWQQMATGELQSAVLEKANRVFSAFAGHEFLLAGPAATKIAAEVPEYRTALSDRLQRTSSLHTESLDGTTNEHLGTERHE